MYEIKAIIQPFMLERVLKALAAHSDLPGVMVSEVLGWGLTSEDRGEDADTETVHEAGHAFARKTKIEIVLPDEMLEPVLEAIETTAHTGKLGDGKIFVYRVDDVIKIRTGARGKDAI